MMPDSSQESVTNPARSLLRPLACFAGLSFARRAIGLLLLPVYIAVLAPEEFAIWILVTLVAGIFGVVANLKLDAAMRTFYFDYESDSVALRQYVTQIVSASTLAAVVLLSVMLLLGAELFERVFRHGSVEFFPAGAIALTTSAANACISPYFVFLRNSLKLQEFAVLQVAIIVGSVSAQLVLMLVLDLGLIGALLGALLPSVLVLLFILTRRTGLIVNRLRPEILGPSLKYSVPLIVFGLFYLLEASLDRFVMEHSVGLAELAGYAVLAALLGLLTIFLDALENAIRPLLFTALKNAAVNSRAQIEPYYRAYVVAGLLALSFIILIGSNLKLVTQDSAYLSVMTWLIFGATAVVPVIITRYHSLYFDFHKRSMDLTVWIIARTVVTFALLTVLVPRFEIAGALAAIFVSQALNAIVFIISAHRKFEIQHSFMQAGAPLLLFIAIIWSLSAFFGGAVTSSFGILQFLVVAISLVLTNFSALMFVLRTEQD